MNFDDYISDCLKAEKYADILNLCMKMFNDGYDGFSAFGCVFEKIVQLQEYHHVSKLNDATPDSSIFKGLTNYYMSGISAREGDIYACEKYLTASLISYKSSMGILQKVPSAENPIKLTLQQKSSIMPGLELGEYMPFNIDIHDGHIDKQTIDGVVFSSCNQIYFERFADKLIQSIPANLICHIHIVNPADAIIEQLQAMTKEYPNFVYSYDNGPEEASYYACRRFQLVHLILENYKKNVIVSDIDVVNLDKINEILSLENFYCGLFKSKQLDPMQFMHLSFSAYEYKEETLNFTKDLYLYLSKKLTEGFPWMLDQCGFLTCGLLHEEKSQNFKINDFRGLLGTELHDYQINQDSNVQEKYELRKYK